MQKHSFQIESKYSEVTQLISTLHDLFIKRGLNSKDQSESEICLVEALNNVVRHSYEDKPENTITLDVAIDKESITFTITDSGKSRTNFSKPKLDYDPDDIENLPESGMGLFIIDQLMDSTYYESEGGKNNFIMIKTFQK